MRAGWKSVFYTRDVVDGENETLCVSDGGLGEMDLVISLVRLRNAVLLAACCGRSLLISTSGRLIYSSGTSQS